MIRVISYGAGVQSTYLLLQWALGLLKFDAALFCNVGDDSEHPATLEYFHNVAVPFAKKHGLELIELHKTMRGTGEIDTLYSRIMKPGSRSVPIPVRMSSNGAPGNRSCTADFKIKVVDRWLREQGAKEQGAQVGLGISLDELQRVKPNMDPATMKWKENIFPLLFELEKPVDRAACIEGIKKAGLPIPPKSACWFCPYHSRSKWQDMRQNEEVLFWKAVELERYVNGIRREIGKDEVWFSSKLVPLDAATTSLQQNSLFDEHEDMCESGYCWI